MSTAEPTLAVGPRIRFQISANGEEEEGLRHSVTILAQVVPLAKVMAPWINDGLKPRMLAVVRLLGLGLPNKAISNRLNCSLRTVESARAKAKKTLGQQLERPATSAEFMTACYMLALTSPEQLALFSVESVLVTKDEECLAS